MQSILFSRLNSLPSLFYLFKKQLGNQLYISITDIAVFTSAQLFILRI